MYFYEIISSCIHFCRKKLWHMSREFIFADDGMFYQRCCQIHITYIYCDAFIADKESVTLKLPTL